MQIVVEAEAKTSSGDCQDALKDEMERAGEAISDTLHKAERQLKHGRDAAEDYVDNITHQIKHRPRAAVLLAFAAGVFATGLFALITRTKRPTLDSESES